MANLRTNPPARDERSDRPLDWKPVNWGTKDDVQRVDRQRQKELERDRDIIDRALRNLQNSDKQVRRTPWLVSRYRDQDIGLRKIPDNTPFWESPDIWVESNDPSGNIVAGKPNHINVRIFNLGGFDAVPVAVQFFWANPSLGLDAAHMVPLNDLMPDYTYIPRLTSAKVRCSKPWIPTYENNGHECLMVNCTCYVSDPIKFPFQPVYDRHVAQKNVHVVQSTPGSAVKLLLNLNNVFPAPVHADVTAALAHLSLDRSLQKTLSVQRLMRAALAHDGRKEELLGLKRLRRSYDSPFIEVAPSGRSRFYAVGEARSGTTDAIALTESKVAPRELNIASALSIYDGRLRAGEQRPMDVQIQVPRSAQPNEVLVYRLHQNVGDRTVGGYSIVILINED